MSGLNSSNAFSSYFFFSKIIGSCSGISDPPVVGGISIVPETGGFCFSIPSGLVSPVVVSILIGGSTGEPTSLPPSPSHLHQVQ